MNLRSSLLILLSLPSLAIAAPPTVMITYFEPFGGASVNDSEQVAKEIQAAKDLGAEVILCRLPVVYDVAPDQAKKCFESATPQPSYVISLGEGDCTLRFETAAHNRDFTPGFPDNSGNIRNYKVIDSKGPPSDSMTFPIDEVLCGSHLSDEERRLVTLSATPGGFVCNNVAYSLSRYFKRLPRGPQYGFVHVPSHQCGDLKSADVSAKILMKYIRTAVQERAEKMNESGTYGDCSRPSNFPRTLRDLDKKINELKRLGQNACRQSYLSEIRAKRLNFLRNEKSETLDYQRARREAKSADSPVNMRKETN